MDSSGIERPGVEEIVEQQRILDAEEWRNFMLKLVFSRLSQLEEFYLKFYSLVDQVEEFDTPTATAAFQEATDALVGVGEILLRFTPSDFSGSPEQVFQAARAQWILDPNNDVALFDDQWQSVRQGIALFKERLLFLESLLASKASPSTPPIPEAQVPVAPPLPASSPPPVPRVLLLPPEATLILSGFLLGGLAYCLPRALACPGLLPGGRIVPRRAPGE